MAKMISSRLALVVRMPLLMPVLPVRARMPPLSMVNVDMSVDAVTPPEAPRLRELTVIGLMNVAALVSDTLARLVREVLTSDPERARRLFVPVVVPPPEESAVAKESPVPETLVSTMAHGTMDLLVLPVPPVCPTKVRPFAEAGPLMTAVFAAAVLPRFVPRKSTVPPPLRATVVLVPRISVLDWEAFGVMVTVLAPAPMVKVPVCSVVAAAELPVRLKLPPNNESARPPIRLAILVVLLSMLSVPPGFTLTVPLPAVNEPLPVRPRVPALTVTLPMLLVAPNALVAVRFHVPVPTFCSAPSAGVALVLLIVLEKVPTPVPVEER